MENYDVNQLEVLSPFNDTGVKLTFINFKKGYYINLFKYHIKWFNETFQKALLIATLFSLPVYGMLLYLNVVALVSISSLYCLITYFAVMVFLILMNRESHTFSKV